MPNDICFTLICKKGKGDEATAPLPLAGLRQTDWEAWIFFQPPNRCAFDGENAQSPETLLS